MIFHFLCQASKSCHCDGRVLVDVSELSEELQNEPHIRMRVKPGKTPRSTL